MAEAARRTGYGHGSDVVRRLIARPIRMHASPGAAPTVSALQVEPVAEALAPADETETTSPDITRLRTEMLLLKAVLQAERTENASLRACIGLDGAETGLGEEARAVRDRWAALLDRLLHAAA